MIRLVRRLFGLDLWLIGPEGEDGYLQTPETEKRPFCDLIQTRREGMRKCNDCTVRHALRVFRKRMPLRYRCHAGLNEIIVPLLIEGKVVAHLTCGHILARKPTPADRRRLLAKYAPMGYDRRSLWRAYRQNKVIPADVQQDLLFLLTLFARHIAASHAWMLTAAMDPRQRILIRAQTFIREGFRERLQLGKIARVCGTSSRTLERVFRAGTGGSISAYLRQVRLEHACSLLRDTRATIAEIALASGFGSVPQFNRTFRGMTGKAPGAWRSANVHLTG